MSQAGRDNIPDHGGGMKWINIKEKMPPKHESVIILKNDGSVYVARLVFNIPSYAQLQIQCECKYPCGCKPNYDAYNITHWAELPPLPISKKELNT